MSRQQAGAAIVAKDATNPAGDKGRIITETIAVRPTPVLLPTKFLEHLPKQPCKSGNNSKTYGGLQATSSRMPLSRELLTQLSLLPLLAFLVVVAFLVVAPFLVLPLVLPKVAWMRCRCEERGRGRAQPRVPARPTGLTEAFTVRGTPFVSAACRLEAVRSGVCSSGAARAPQTGAHQASHGGGHFDGVLIDG